MSVLYCTIKKKEKDTGFDPVHYITFQASTNSTSAIGSNDLVYRFLVRKMKRTSAAVKQSTIDNNKEAYDILSSI